MSRVYIGNLGDNASKREIESEFEYFGPLRDVWVARNPPGFAFCVFEDHRDAEDAVRELDGKRIGGNRIRVELARGPSRGGRAARLGLKEKCYECGRVGHFARNCTRRRRSRSPYKKRYSRSRSQSPRRRGSRSPERRHRSRSKSGSRDRDRRSRSGSNERQRQRSQSRSRSRSPQQERSSPKPDGENAKEERKRCSRSPSPQQDQQDD